MAKNSEDINAKKNMSTSVNKNTLEKTISFISILFSRFQNSTHFRGLPGKAFAFRVHRFNSPANSQQVLSMPLSDHGSWTKRPLKHNHVFSQQKRRVKDFFDWFFNKYTRILMQEILHRWDLQLIPLFFTGFYTAQVVVWKFFRDKQIVWNQETLLLLEAFLEVFC